LHPPSSSCPRYSRDMWLNSRCLGWTLTGVRLKLNAFPVIGDLHSRRAAHWPFVHQHSDISRLGIEAIPSQLSDRTPRISGSEVLLDPLPVDLRLSCDLSSRHAQSLGYSSRPREVQPSSARSLVASIVETTKTDYPLLFHSLTRPHVPSDGARIASQHGAAISCPAAKAIFV
ncbi:hypothetical protein, partial [Acidovorax facilis]